jgi:DNA-directed RNA polymerase specialized sigma24 family protein
MGTANNSFDFRQLFRRLASLDPAAFGELATRLRRPLLEAARRRLRKQPELRPVYDPEDALDSGLAELWKGLLHGKIAAPRDRDKFLRVARTIVARRIVARARQERAAKRNPSPCPDPRWSVGPFKRLMPEHLELYDLGLPSAEAAVIARDELNWLLGLLDEGHRELAVARLEGWTVAQIARRRDERVRTIERRIAEIRAIWCAALREHDPDGPRGPPCRDSPAGSLPARPDERIASEFVMTEHSGSASP